MLDGPASGPLAAPSTASLSASAAPQALDARRRSIDRKGKAAKATASRRTCERTVRFPPPRSAWSSSASSGATAGAVCGRLLRGGCRGDRRDASAAVGEAHGVGLRGPGGSTRLGEGARRSTLGRSERPADRPAGLEAVAEQAVVALSLNARAGIVGAARSRALPGHNEAPGRIGSDRRPALA